MHLHSTYLSFHHCSVTIYSDPAVTSTWDWKHFRAAALITVAGVLSKIGMKLHCIQMWHLTPLKQTSEAQEKCIIKEGEFLVWESMIYIDITSILTTEPRAQFVSLMSRQRGSHSGTRMRPEVFSNILKSFKKPSFSWNEWSSLSQQGISRIGNICLNCISVGSDGVGTGSWGESVLGQIWGQCRGSEHFRSSPNQNISCRLMPSYLEERTPAILVYKPLIKVLEGGG